MSKVKVFNYIWAFVYVSLGLYLLRFKSFTVIPHSCPILISNCSAYYPIVIHIDYVSLALALVNVGLAVVLLFMAFFRS